MTYVFGGTLNIAHLNSTQRYSIASDSMDKPLVFGLICCDMLNSLAPVEHP